MSFYKILLLAIFFISANSNSIAQPLFFDHADQLLQAYVEDGKVLYEILAQDKSLINELSREIGDLSLQGRSPNEEKAFYINAYNLLVIKEVTEHYPVSSPLDIQGIFEGKKHRVAGKMLTLNELEKEVLMKKFFDPRLHFVLVCGANGCPPIPARAFRPENVEVMIQNAASAALNDDDYIRVDRKRKIVELPMIFKWYRDDFVRDSTNMIAFLNLYRKERIPENFEITYYPYDWSLNIKKKSEVSWYPSASDTQNEAKEINYYLLPSSLLRKGHMEWRFFSNLYSQTHSFDAMGRKINLTSRASYFTEIAQWSYGISSRFNIGMDMLYKAVSLDPPASTPLAIFHSGKNERAQSGLTGMGPKIRWIPFRSLPRLSIQSTLYFPVKKDMEGGLSGKPFLEYDRLFLWTQINMDRMLHRQWQLYGGLDVWLRSDFSFDPERFLIATPLKMILSWFPGEKSAFYYLTEWAPTFGEPFISSYYLQSGLGFKYFILEQLEAELLFTDFLLGKNSGAGKTYNIGLRYILQR